MIKFKGMDLTPDMKIEDMADNFESSLVRPIYPVIRDLDTMADDTKEVLVTAMLVAIVDAMTPNRMMLEQAEKSDMVLEMVQVTGSALVLAINEKVALNVPTVISEFTQLFMYKIRMMNGKIPLHDIALNRAGMTSPAMAKRLAEGAALDAYADIRTAIRNR